MIQRCTNPSHHNYKNWGGRGISVCDQWRYGESNGQSGFECWLAYIEANLGPKPSPRYSQDRIDNDGHYQPGNVRWATPEQQARNQRPRRPPTSGIKGV